MRRALLLVLAALMVFSCLTGCIGGTEEFTCQDLKMTVPSGMRDVTGGEQWSEYTFTLDSSEVAIFGLKEDFDLFDDSITLEEYADLVVQANQLDVRPIQRSTGDYLYFQYNNQTDEGIYRYLCGVYKGKDGFWMVQVASLLTDYEESDFFSYLDSVTLS